MKPTLPKSKVKVPRPVSGNAKTPLVLPSGKKAEPESVDCGIKAHNGHVSPVAEEKAHNGHVSPVAEEKAHNGHVSPVAEEKAHNGHVSPVAEEKAHNGHVSPVAEEKAHNGHVSPVAEEEKSDAKKDPSVRRSYPRGDRTLTRWVAGVGLGVFGLCVVAALFLGFSSLNLIGQRDFRGHGNAQGLAGEILKLTKGAKANEQALYGSMLLAEGHVRNVTNRHALLLAGMFVGFGFVGAGFALFAVGAQGAFEFEGEKSEAGKFLLKATAPGLLCFVLAAIITVTALVVKYELNFGALQLDSDPEFVRATQAANEEKADPATTTIMVSPPSPSAPILTPTPFGSPLLSPFPTTISSNPSK